MSGPVAAASGGGPGPGHQNAMPVHWLSKSRYLAGMQCAKRLWNEVHRPGLLSPADAALQSRFDQGHEVGLLARQLFPGGIEIGRRLGWAAALAATAEALRQRRPLYEAAFEHGGAACRVDILVPVEEEGWILYEVKSGTSPAPVNRLDVAFQSWVVRGAGLPLRQSNLVHLNSGYERNGELDIEKLFTLVDETGAAATMYPNVRAEVAEMRAALEQGEPETPIGPHCGEPYACPLKAHCWEEIPEENVFTLYRGGGKGWQLFREGVVDLARIPPGFELTDRQVIQVEAARRGAPRIDAPSLREFLSRLSWPLYFLDFETFARAIPPYDGTRPYQQVPFQFSIHRVDSEGAPARPAAFLADGQGDPRPAFLAALRRELGELESGSIVAYGSSFESRILLESARGFPEFEEWAQRVDGRIVDLLEPFREFSYYHPAQLGSASLKSVLPVLGNRGYDHLEIQSGDVAALDYLRSELPATPADERQRIRQALLEYCGRDTEGMVEIVAALQRLAAEPAAVRNGEGID